jgi:glucan phosphorylase
MNKIILLGLRDLATEEKIEPMTDYGIFLIGQRVSEELEDQDSDDKPVSKYRIKIERIDSIMNLKTKSEIKFEKGKSPSQKMRYLVETKTQSYDDFMKWALGNIDRLCEEYLEYIGKSSNI